MYCLHLAYAAQVKLTLEPGRLEVELDSSQTDLKLEARIEPRLVLTSPSYPAQPFSGYRIPCSLPAWFAE